jgi:hypothetical protein
MVDGWHNYLDSTQLLPKRHSIYGTPVVKEDREYGVFRSKTPTEDKVMQEMFDIGAAQKPMSKTIVMGGIQRELTPVELDQVNDILSKLDVKGTLEKVIQTEQYQSIQDAATRQDILEKVVSGYRQTAKGLFIKNNQQVVEEMKGKLREKALAVSGQHIAPDPKTRLLHWNDWSTIRQIAGQIE